MNQTNQRLDSKGNILMRFGDTLASLSMKYMPEPSTFAVLFTIIAFQMCIRDRCKIAVQSAVQNVQPDLLQLSLIHIFLKALTKITTLQRNSTLIAYGNAVFLLI